MQKIEQNGDGAGRIVPLNLRSENERLSGRTVQETSDAPLPEAGSCVSWACAAVRG